MILGASDGFRELWDIGLPVENLSMRRRNAGFGWINRPEYNGLLSASFCCADSRPRYFRMQQSEKVEARIDSPYMSVVQPCFDCYHFQSLRDYFSSILI
jgi:hypothetical protein